MTDENTMFCNLTSHDMASFIRSAKESVCYAAPGIQSEVAGAIADVAQRFGPEMTSVSLDFDERVIRMGFGSIDGVSQLREKGVAIQSCPGLRTGLLIVDGSGFVFTPTALYLEDEKSLPSAPNAMRMSSEQLRKRERDYLQQQRQSRLRRRKRQRRRQRLNLFPWIFKRA